MVETGLGWEGLTLLAFQRVGFSGSPWERLPENIVDYQKSGQGGEPQTVHTLRQGEPTLYWFLLIHYRVGLLYLYL